MVVGHSSRRTYGGLDFSHRRLRDRKSAKLGFRGVVNDSCAYRRRGGVFFRCRYVENSTQDTRSRLAALLMSAAWFIWPTPWREYQVVRVIRVHRITGKTQQLYVTGWRPIEPRR